jgi:hypothetical protein
MKNIPLVCFACLATLACTIRNETAPTPASGVATPSSDPPIAQEADDPAPVATPLPAQEPLDEPPETTTPAERLGSIAKGKPAGMDPGAPAAFWIWRADSGVWKVRTTTAKQPHTFRGRVQGVTAPIGAIRASRNELHDRVARAPNGSVFFKFTTNGNVDGFDFRVRDNACVRFDLKLDGGAVPKRIHIGSQQVEPKSNHFELCP